MLSGLPIAKRAGVFSHTSVGADVSHRFMANLSLNRCSRRLLCPDQIKGRKVHILVSQTYLKVRARSEWPQNGLRPQHLKTQLNVGFWPFVPQSASVDLRIPSQHRRVQQLSCKDIDDADIAQSWASIAYERGSEQRL